MAEGAKTILVVDDDPDTRTFLTTVLQDNGYNTATAEDGVQALASIEESAPDLVALDITMPEKSGVAVYRKLKEDDKLEDIALIAENGNGEEEHQA